MYSEEEAELGRDIAPRNGRRSIMRKVLLKHKLQQQEYVSYSNSPSEEHCMVEPQFYVPSSPV